MANPKYIDESLLHEDNKDEKVTKKVTKKAYSFRCDETLLEDMTTYAEMEDISLPQLLSNIMADFLEDKILSNDYLRGYEGMYINIMSNAYGSSSIFEYELRYVINNLDMWTADYGYVSGRLSHGIMHEGVDFVVIPETVHKGKLPDNERMGLREYYVDFNEIESCLYCIYVTVDINHKVEYEVISWIDAMNKLKASERYDLIAHGNKIKKQLEKLHQNWNSEKHYYKDEVFQDDIYRILLSIADEYNTGAIVPADISIDNIEYAAIVEKLPDGYEIINNLMEENKRLKGMEDQLIAIKSKMDEMDKMTDEEAWEYVKSKYPNVDDLDDA